jgi:hypothetical protein
MQAANAIAEMQCHATQDTRPTPARSRHATFSGSAKPRLEEKSKRLSISQKAMLAPLRTAKAESFTETIRCRF